MIIAVDKENMENEGRVALLPQGVQELVASKNEVIVANSAGVASGFPTEGYQEAGAKVASRDYAWGQADLMVRVKQPLEKDYEYLRPGLILACFGHLVSNKPLLERLLKTQTTLIDYGHILLADGSRPILRGMSRLAGMMAVLDAEYLLRQHKHKIMSRGTTAVVIGMGNLGYAAVLRILPTNTRLICVDSHQNILQSVKGSLVFEDKIDVNTKIDFLKYDPRDKCDQEILAFILRQADFAIGATRSDNSTIPPVPAWMVKEMQENSVIVDPAIDDGGCFETSTRFYKTGENVFQEHGVWHSCVPNTPGSIGPVSSPILCASSLPYIKEIAEKGFEKSVRENPSLARGVHTYKGWITDEYLAKKLGWNGRYRPLKALLGI